MDISSRLLVNQALLQAQAGSVAPPSSMRLRRLLPPRTTDFPTGKYYGIRSLLARLSTADAQFRAHDFAQRLHWSAGHGCSHRAAGGRTHPADVQQRCDAVLEYTARFDGLQADSMAALEPTKQELKDRPTACQPPSEALESAVLRAAITRRRKRPMARAGLPRRRYQHAAGHRRSRPLDPRASYAPGGKRRLSVQRADERHSRPCSRWWTSSWSCPRPRVRKNPLVLAAAYVAGAPRLHHRWRPGRGCPGLRNGCHRAQGGQDHPVPAMPMWPAPRSACSASWAST